MNRPALLLSVAACSTLFAVAPRAEQSFLQSRVCPNSIRHEPLLIFERSGGTLLGPMYRSLTVYSDGRVSLSKNDTVFLDARVGQDVAVATISISPADAAGFWALLVDAGAFSLCDMDAQVTDVPLNTVTIFDGRTDSNAHTYSYWIAIDEYAGVGTLLSNFIATHFPDF
ncbi:MAG: hypothetical protein E2O39_00215 [Planctomycetota bacterium]|nr:MAG: hypothetical protein E2O39_00215 [Planctomycetota bacterium]